MSSGRYAVRDGAEEAFAEFVGRHWAEAVRFFRQGLFRDRDRPNAEDCAQEAFLKLARRYRDDTATARAIHAHERATGRSATASELASRLRCEPGEATSRAERAVVSDWLHATAYQGERAFAVAKRPTTGEPILDLAPLAAMRWSTYRNVLTDYGRRRLAMENARADDLEQLVATGAEPRDPHPNPENATLGAALHAQLADCLGRLAKAERTVLVLHYFHGLRFPAIAAMPTIGGIVTTAHETDATRDDAQLVQRLKDLAKAGRRHLRSQCPQLADFLAGGDDAP
jgi:RNA polymerase sigma factor (sigma-70 family)